MTLVELYAKRIRQGLMVREDIPPRWKKAVEVYLAELDLQNELKTEKELIQDG